MIRYRAEWVLPISRPPIRGGVVGVDRDRITSVGAHDGGEVEELGSGQVVRSEADLHEGTFPVSG